MLPNMEQVIIAGGVLVVWAIVFAESGLLVGFFLPGDSLLFTAGKNPGLISDVLVVRDDARAAHGATDYYQAAARIFLECLAGDHMAEAARRGLTDPFEGLAFALAPSILPDDAIVHVAVLYEKPQTTYSPDLAWRSTDNWIRFPWIQVPPVRIVAEGRSSV